MCYVPPAWSAQGPSCFACRISVHLSSKERRAECLSLSLHLPWGFLSALSRRTRLQQAVSSATAFRPPSGIHPWPKPAGCFSHSCLRAYILALAMGGAGFFFPFSFLFLFCLCVCCCCSIYTFQNCHAGPPLPPTAVRRPLQGDSKPETNNIQREISKCIQRNVLLQRQ